METVIWGLLAVVAVANAVVTNAVFRSGIYERSQKTYQAILIWFLPIAGAVLAWYMLREHPPGRITNGDALERDPMFDGTIRTRTAYSEGGPADHSDASSAAEGGDAGSD